MGFCGGERGEEDASANTLRGASAERRRRRRRQGQRTASRRNRSAHDAHTHDAPLHTYSTQLADALPHPTPRFLATSTPERASDRPGRSDDPPALAPPNPSFSRARAWARARRKTMGRGRALCCALLLLPLLAARGAHGPWPAADETGSPCSCSDDGEGADSERTRDKTRRRARILAARASASCSSSCSAYTASALSFERRPQGLVARRARKRCHRGGRKSKERQRVDAPFPYAALAIPSARRSRVGRKSGGIRCRSYRDPGVGRARPLPPRARAHCSPVTRAGAARWRRAMAAGFPSSLSRARTPAHPNPPSSSIKNIHRTRRH
jgi:hypothetical protein